MSTTCWQFNFPTLSSTRFVGHGYFSLSSFHTDSVQLISQESGSGTDISTCHSILEGI